MELLVTIRDKIATYAEMRPYVCGNSDYVIHFDMDEEWAAHETKTARFVKDDGTYHDQVFTGNDCPVPVISNTFSIRVGVFAGDLHTTTPAYIPAKKSILCGSGMPSAPSDDVYAQLMEHLNQIEQNGVSEAEIKAAIAAYLEENPVEGVTPEEVEAAIEKYMQEHPVLVEESDPTVPDWAKQPEKPTYTAQEVGAQPKGDYALKSEIPNVPVQSVNGQTGNVQLDIPPAYELPTASADILGGVKVGNGLQMNGEALEIMPEPYMKKYTSVTLEEPTLVVELDIPHSQEVIVTGFVGVGTAADSGYVLITGKGLGVGTLGSVLINTTVKTSFRAHAFTSGSIWTPYFYKGNEAEGSASYGPVNPHVFQDLKGLPSLNHIKIYCFKNGFPKGTVFNVFLPEVSDNA